MFYKKYDSEKEFFEDLELMKNLLKICSEFYDIEVLAMEDMLKDKKLL